MTALAEVPPLVATLSSLAHDANQELAAIEANDTDSLQRAIRVGEYLIQAKAMCPKGQWTVWLKENVLTHYTTAYRYMRIAEYQDEVAHCVSIIRATEWLQDAGSSRHVRGSDHPWADVNRVQALTENARALYAGGKKQVEIAAMLGISQSRVSQLLTDQASFAAQQQAYSKARNARRAAEKKALAEKEQRAAVKRYGGNAEAMYTHVLKACEAAGQLSADKPELKAKVDDILAGLYREKDKILAMIGAS